MTMQIAMVGTDGIVIASDTRWMFTPAFTEPAAPRHTYGSTKIKVNATEDGTGSY